MSYEDLEELEELNEIEEAGDSEITTGTADFTILSIPCVQVWQASYEKSRVPFAVLDNKLRIIWTNDMYTVHLGKGRNLIGDYFTKLFYLEKNQDQIDSMYKTIFREDTGYSWKGRLESGSREHLPVIVNTLMFPIFTKSENNSSPIGFGVIMDDITEDQNSLVRGTFSSLLEASKLKDNDTGQHIQRVNEYSRTIAQAIFNDSRFPEVDREFIENIGFLAAMHDVGKIGTPDDILNKQGPLEDREWKIMQEHTINGAYILSTYPNPIAKDIALFHHEKWDGSGYPYKITKDLIPLAARIVSIADVYDALRMKRSYKDHFSHDKARNIIMSSAGSHFDPRLVEIFSYREDDFVKIYSELADE